MKYSPTEEEVTERAIENATNNLTTTDIWDAINQAGLANFEQMLKAFHENKSEVIGNEVIKLINEYIEEHLIDLDYADEQLTEEHYDRSE